jgi:hypothetical protein
VRITERIFAGIEFAAHPAKARYMPGLLPENQSADYLSDRHMKVRDSSFLRSALGLLLLLPGLARAERANAIHCKR